MALRGNSLVYQGGIIPRGGFDVCPQCGGLKSKRGEKCKTCQRIDAAAEQERVAQAERIRIRRERQPRYEAALAAGWTPEDLTPRRDEDNYDVDPLPTWEEILQRNPKIVIERWWRMTDGT